MKSLHAVALASGVSVAAISRFLRGSTINSDTFDALTAWLERT